MGTLSNQCISVKEIFVISDAVFTYMLDIANEFSILTFGVSLGFRVSVCAEITSFPVATGRQTAAESARELQKEIKTLDVPIPLIFALLLYFL